MKVFVFAYDRYEDMTTSRALEAEGISHTVLCHTEEALERFVAGGTAERKRLFATGNAKGLANQRNTALEMMDEGEWALFLCDDIKRVTELRNYDRTTSATLPINLTNQNHYGKRFDNPISLSRFMLRAEQLVTKCETHNCKLGGFAGINNPLYRAKHWGFNIMADGRAWVVQKSWLRFDTKAQMVDDVAWTALNIKHFGLVIVNQWVLPDFKRYTPGAFKSIDERLQQKMAECKHLVETYPDQIAYKDKAGWPYGSHIVIRQRNKPKHLMGRR
jgi:hypothetical protein